MSDGKSSSYRVVSAEELRRRALAAAHDRLARANEAAVALRVFAGGAEDTYGDIVASTPDARTSSSDDPAVVDSLALRLETEVNAARGRLETRIAAARARQLDEVSSRFLAGLRPDEPLAALEVRHPRRAELPGAEQLADSLRLVRRLPGDAPSGSVDRCEQMISEISSAASASRADVVLTALRAEVQTARDRSETMARNRVELDRLYRELDGLEGEEVSATRGYLRGVTLETPIGRELVERVERVRDGARRDQDRRFALEVTREVLLEQGYALGEDFVTIVGSGEGAIVPLAASRRHGVRIRERSGQLLFNVVRFARTDDGVDDTDAATAFCTSFAAVVRRAGDSGLSMTRVAHFDPGSGRIEVRDAESPFTEDAAAQKRRQSRERQRR